MIYKYRLPIILVFTIAFLFMTDMAFYQKVVISDDWSVLQNIQKFSRSGWIDVEDRRPLLMIPYRFVWEIFGMNLNIFYIFQTGLHFLWVVLLFLILDKIVPQKFYYLTLVTPYMFLVFPVDYTRMWLTMFSIHFTILLLLLFAYLSLAYIQEGRIWSLFLAVICLSVSLFIYEAQIGIVLLVIIFFLLYSVARHIPFHKVLALWIPAFIVLAFIFWRYFGIQTIGIRDNYFEKVTFSLPILLSRLVYGYKVLLMYGWTKVLLYIFPWLTHYKIALVFLVTVISGISLVSSWFLNRKGTINLAAERISFVERWRENRILAGMAFLGFVLLGAGYIPIIFAFEGNLNAIGSRMNLFATIGGAILLCSVLYLLAGLLVQNKQHINIVFILSVLPFLFLGIATQYFVQRGRAIVWNEQKEIWQALFNAAPDLADGANVVIVMPGYQDRIGYQDWRFFPLSSFWEITCGLQLLYNNPTLTGDIYYPDVLTGEVYQPVLTAQEIVYPQEIPNLTKAYSNSVFFVWNSAEKNLQQLIHLPPAWMQDATEPVYLKANVLLPDVNREMPLRYLVEDAVQR